jgi:hypothetical protein
VESGECGGVWVGGRRSVRFELVADLRMIGWDFGELLDRSMGLILDGMP